MQVVAAFLAVPAPRALVERQGYLLAALASSHHLAPTVDPLVAAPEEVLQHQAVVLPSHFPEHLETPVSLEQVHQASFPAVLEDLSAAPQLAYCLVR